MPPDEQDATPKTVREPADTPSEDAPADTAMKARIRLIAAIAAVIVGIVYFWAAATRSPIVIGMGDTTYSLSATALVIFGVIMILGAVMLVIEWSQMRPDTPENDD